MKLDQEPDGLAIPTSDGDHDSGETADERIGRLYVASDIAADDIDIPSEVFAAFRSSASFSDLGSLSHEEFAEMVKEDFTSEKPEGESAASLDR